MVRKLLFSALAAIVLAAGFLMTSALPGSTAPVLMSPITQAQAGNLVIPVAACGPWNNWCQGSPNCGPWNNWCQGSSNCGPWNNWCQPSGGGGGCITVGGVRLCIGGTGPNCHWYNGVKYCNYGGGGGGSCIHVYGHTYCSYKHSDCIWVNGTRYCRY